MTVVLFQLVSGFVWGWVVALVALGLSLIYGVLRVINVAHGALYMLGAAVGVALYDPLQSALGNAPLAFALVLVLSPLLVGALGALLEATTLRPLVERGRFVMTIVTTFALLLILQQGAQLLLPGVRSVPAPLAGGVELWGLRYPLYRLVLAAIAMLLLGLTALFLYRTRFGLWARAVRQDRELALSLGIPAPWVYSGTFALGAALAAAAGWLTAPIVSVDPMMGMDILLQSFLVVIVGGLGSLRGAVVAALLLRLAEGLLTVWFDPVGARALALLLMGALLLLRPHGLFGREEAPA